MPHYKDFLSKVESQRKNAARLPTIFETYKTLLTRLSTTNPDNA
jgi:hypothetical protein